MTWTYDAGQLKHSEGTGSGTYYDISFNADSVDALIRVLEYAGIVKRVDGGKQ